MKGRKSRLYSNLAAALIAAVLYSGCGGHDRLYEQVNGEMAWSDLDADSLPATAEPESYFVGYGDVMDVNFLYDEEYSRVGIKVRPDGRITFPLAGEIFVAGMSPMEIDSVLTASFSEIILDPQVTVIMTEFQPQLVYVLGEVGNAGDFEYVRDMTLMQALSMANGYTDDARKSNVVVIRRIGEDHIIGMEVDIDAILSMNDFSHDIVLKPFDIIYVPKSRIATTEQFISRLWMIIGRPMDLYLKGWQVANIQLYYDYYSRIVNR
jgi:polysaccharide export outer membrane protein